MSTQNTPSYYLLPDGRDILDITLPMSNACGNALKYLKRAGLKPNEPMLKDLKKALDYLDREMERESLFFCKELLTENLDEISVFVSDKPFGFTVKIKFYSVARNVFGADATGFNTESRQRHLKDAISHLTELINSLEAQNE